MFLTAPPMAYTPTMRFPDAERFLLGRRREGMKFGLHNMERAMRILGRPHERYPSLLVAGSKGKGSVCSLVESILQAAGFRTGLYTSPHLVHIRERIRVDGRPIPPSSFGRLVARLRRSFGATGPPLTYFEWLTAMAITHFREEKVDLAIFEVGLGGRLDATNIVPAETAVVTSVEKEHTDYLGTRLGDIAREKGGVVSPGGVLLSGVTSPTARRELGRLVSERAATVRWLDDEISWSVRGQSLRGVSLDMAAGDEEYTRLRLGLLGRHQGRNAALAFLAVRHLRSRGFAAGRSHVRAGLARVSWPGRCQYLPGRPPLFLDGAHTPSSARALAEALDELFPGRRRVIVFGALKDKKIDRLASILFPGSHRIVLVRPPEERGPAAEDLLRRVPSRWRSRCLLARSVPSALRIAAGGAGSRGLVVVTGSLFLVGDVLRRLP
jgi:dihydrofolate synthase/folylpolyglutamate synthase